MRGRHASELAASLRHAMTNTVARRSRRHEQLRRALASFDPRHQLAAVRARLVSREGTLAKALTRRVHVADLRFKALAARLDGLSPLAVLGRGYAVCWDSDRTRILRDASTVRAGENVSVTLAKGELRCAVTGHEE